MKINILILIFILSCNLMGIEVSLSTTEVKQGDLFTLTLPEKGSFEVSFPKSNTPIRIYPMEGQQLAIIPVHYSTVPGSYPVIVRSKDKTIFENTIKVTDGRFEKSYITVSSSTGQKKSKKNIKAMVNHARESRKNPTTEKLWKGKFSYPVAGRITSPFGATRYVNNKFSGYHSGTDFAVPIGSPILATNTGKVVLSMFLRSTGNTIIIDHGLNLFSSYSHMDSLNVEAGDRVKKGDLIGRSGNTGFSTGPHLHFTMSIGNTFVDPFLFIEKEFVD